MSRRLQADLSLAFCSLLWGATFVLVKDALSSASVFVFLFLRFLFAALALVFIYRAALRDLNRRALAAGSLLGSLMFAGFALQTIGIRFTTPSKAAFITGASVVMVPLLHAWTSRRRPGPWVLAGALAAFIGLYFLTVPAAGLGDLNRGDLWVLACAVVWAFHILAVGHYSPRLSVGALTFTQVAVAAVLSAVFLPLLRATNLEIPRLAWNRELILAVVVTSLGATAVAFSLQVWAQKFTSPAHVAILFSLEPVFAALTSFAFYGERFTARALAGAALVLAGILLSELKGPAPAAPESAVPEAPARAG
ncbi:MAG TPA: DMT family transporter [Candidatus Dormibacteraeota bacterium]|nr:DMT family transporter [Candidatus Dormibacteraeota bacterium]